MSLRPNVTPEPPAPAMKDRPACPWCDKRLQPLMEREVDWGAGFADGIVFKSYGWTGRYSAYGAFCTRQCATKYANWVFSRTGLRYLS